MSVKVLVWPSSIQLFDGFDGAAVGETLRVDLFQSSRLRTLHLAAVRQAKEPAKGSTFSRSNVMSNILS
jgi:hypothetical protein